MAAEAAIDTPVVYAAEPAVEAAPVVYAAQPAIEAVPVVYAAQPAVEATPVVYAAQPVHTAPVVYTNQAVQAAPAVYNVAPVQVAVADSQYHSQDDIGQYSYGYSDGNSVKQELKTADGVVRGSYSYVDSDGLVQTVNYIADALGFRVGATNLPVHIVDGASAPVAEAQPAVAVAYTGAVEDETVASPVLSPLVPYTYLPYASNYAYNLPAVAPVQESAVVANAPLPLSAAPVVSVAAPVAVQAAAPAADVNSQFHAQDEFGQYNYGYSNPTQTKSEIKTADGVTRGTYSYLDPNGLIQTVNYISDAMGFRVAATNLPVHNVGTEAEPQTVEVAKYSALTPSVEYAYLPYAQNYAYNTPSAA